jgi:hypothetical protein
MEYSFYIPNETLVFNNERISITYNIMSLRNILINI